MNKTSNDIRAVHADRAAANRRLWRWMAGILIVVVIAFAGAHVYQYQRQMTLIKEIEEYLYVHVYPAKTYPDWMHRCLGRKRMLGLEPIETISFTKTQDGALKLVARTNVRNLYAQDFSASEAAIAATSRMTSLNQLMLWPDADDMHYPKTFPEKLAGAVAGLPQLEKLDLRHFSLSPETLRQLRTSRSLTNIVFNRCQAAVPGISQLAELKSLRELHIDTRSGGPELLNELSQLTQLTVLQVDLYALDLNDEDLQVLSRLKSLRNLNLNLRYTEVTQDGIDNLQKALPKCRIEVAIGGGVTGGNVPK
jgi:hypothetical protein